MNQDTRVVQSPSSTEQPHERIERDSRQMDLLEQMPREWTSLENIRSLVDFESVDRYLHDLREWGFVDRRRKSGEKIKYRISILGMGVRQHYRTEGEE